MNKMLDAALEYARKGWPIFPCKKNKAPWIEDGVLGATTREDKIREWWEKYPHANIGLDVGRCDMMVLDLDPGHDWDKIEDAIGEVPDTMLVQKTPRGGEHLFFAKDKSEVIPPSASKIAPHVDVRSFNSYVLLAPSSTADGDYSWESQGKPAYRTDKMVEAAKQRREVSDNRDTWIIEPDLEENINAAIKWLKNDAEIAIEGRNGDHMAYATAAMMKSYGLTPETGFDLMWEYWNPRCDPPWSADQVEHLQSKVDNGYSYNTSPPGNMTNAYRTAKRMEMFQPVSRDTKGGGEEVISGRFRIVDRPAIREIKPPEWLIPDFIPEQSYGLLIGERGSYKSFVALDIALSIATGASDVYQSEDDWLGPWPNVVHKGPVLYIAGEGRASLKKRVEAWEARHLDGEEAKDFYLADPVPHPTEEDTEGFIEAAKRLSDYYELIVLDTVGRSMAGMNENSQQDASQFSFMVDALRRHLDCTVLAIHHSGHGEKGRARGSSVFGADVDFEYVLERKDKTTVELENTKQKDAPEWDEPRLIGIDEEGDSLVAVAPSEQQLKLQEQRKQKKDSKKKNKDGDNAKKLMLQDLVRDVAFEILKSTRKEFSGRGLAEAIATHEKVTVPANTIRTTYLGELTTDKTHPVSICFDYMKGRYTYRETK